jgi:ubiquinol-cytochrome c reductase cytochrome b subunit
LISFFFIIQLSSGIILSTSYTSDVTFAYYSISSIIREVYSGWCFRYIHSQGASFIFALYFLHIARAVVYSSCLFLQAVFFSGIWLFIFLILIAFIGYLLPWGMLSFWGATVIINILSFIPLLIELICGGYFISTSTLKRFFVIHFALPFLSFYLIFIHLFYLHLLGSNNPLGANINNKIPFFPFLVSKDIFGFYFSMLIFAIQTLFGLLPLSHPDNATAGNGFLTPLHILPEWYFLPFYAILKAIPNKNAGFIILFYFSFFYLFFLSIFGSAGLNRSLSQFPSFILLLLALGWIGCQLPQEKFISYGRIFLSIILFFALYVLDPSCTVIFSLQRKFYS